MSSLMFGESCTVISRAEAQACDRYISQTMQLREGSHCTEETSWLKVVGLDFAAEMLQYARKRATTEVRRQSAEIEWVEGDATNLSFQDQSFDAATMGYGLRNVGIRPCSSFFNHIFPTQFSLACS